MKNRADLDADLFQLRAALPLWRRALASEQEFQTRCASMAADLLESTAPKDREYVAMHLRDTLGHHRQAVHEFRNDERL